MLLPSHILIRVAAAWLLLACLVVFFPLLLSLWVISGMLLVTVCLVDGVWVLMMSLPAAERTLPGRFAVGEKGEVRLKLINRTNSTILLDAYDGIPAAAQTATMPWQVTIPAQKHAIIHYQLIIPERGAALFSAIAVKLHSPMRLWQRSVLLPQEQMAKVYPNYAPVLRLTLMATQHRQAQMGIVRRSQAGSSKDFHQLRDYRQGDSLSQIDWKSTSRRLQLISRDYQDQRNQQIVFLLDCGRRMRSMDGDLPHFDHCLNALLLVSYVALRQGDHVAVQSFGGPDRWLPPVKGGHAMATILNHLYDASTTQSPSDFAEAAERLMMRNRRRALVIVMTNLRGEDSEEIIPALKTMQSRHLVLLASLREGVVRDAVENPVVDFPSALKHVAARQYMEERRETLVNLSSHGILTMDVTADQLAIGLANRYLDIKAAGSL